MLLPLPSNIIPTYSISYIALYPSLAFIGMCISAQYQQVGRNNGNKLRRKASRKHSLYSHLQEVLREIMLCTFSARVKIRPPSADCTREKTHKSSHIASPEYPGL